MRYIQLYFQFLNLQLKTILQYKSDFIIGVLSVLIGQINMFLLTILVFSQMDVLAGFNLYEMFLMYGFFVMVKGMDHFYNDNIWSFAWNKIKDGRFSEILLRPLNPIFYIVMERVEISGLSEVIIGLIIIILSGNFLHLSLGVLDILLLCILCICGLVIFFAVKLLFSAPAFWTVCCGEFMTAGIEISNTSKYPLTIYKNAMIQKILLYLLPFPIAAYFPAIFCLKRDTGTIHILNGSIGGYEIVLYSVVVASILLFVSIKIWYIGLKRFEPTGT